MPARSTGKASHLSQFIAGTASEQSDHLRARQATADILREAGSR